MAAHSNSISATLHDPFARLAKSVPGWSPSKSASQRAFDLILQGIMTGVLPAGQRLPEIPLATALALGRTPVREALMRLEMDGFVVSEPRYGMVVAGSTVRSMAEIYELMEVIEGFACRLAARYSVASDHAALRAVLAEAEAPTAAVDVAALRKLNSRFHHLIHLASRNDQLMREMKRLLNLISRSPSSAYSQPGRAAAAMAEHHALMAAIVARDEAQAEALAIAHKCRDKEARLVEMMRDVGE